MLWVPTTINRNFMGAIKKKLDEIDGPKGLKTMIVEKPGRSIKEMLKLANPFPREDCGRAECPWKIRNEMCNMRCYKEGMTYYAVCLECLQNDMSNGEDGTTGDTKLRVYIGESHRSITTRRLTHLSKCSTNWMNLHNQEYHRDEYKNWDNIKKKNQFDFRPIKNFTKVLERQWFQEGF